MQDKQRQTLQSPSDVVQRQTLQSPSDVVL